MEPLPDGGRLVPVADPDPWVRQESDFNRKKLIPCDLIELQTPVHRQNTPDKTMNSDCDCKSLNKQFTMLLH